MRRKKDFMRELAPTSHRSWPDGAPRFVMHRMRSPRFGDYCIFKPIFGRGPDPGLNAYGLTARIPIDEAIEATMETE